MDRHLYTKSTFARLGGNLVLLLRLTYLVLTIFLLNSTAHADYGFFSSAHPVGLNERPLGNVFFYQGAYPELGTFEEVAQIMAKFDVIVLTHAFSVTNENKTVGPGTGQVDLILSNGKCIDERAEWNDGQGHDIARLIARVKLLRSGKETQFFGYLPLTADNPKGCWDSTAEAQNFICPNGYCRDFVGWANKWDSLPTASAIATATIDGFFLDLASELHVHSIAMVSMFSYLNSFKNSSGQRKYRLMPNIIYSGKPCTLGETRLMASGVWKFQYWNVPRTCQFTSTDALDFLAGLTGFDNQYLMRAGDYFLMEGFPLRAGSFDSVSGQAGIDVGNKLLNFRNSRNIGWLAITSERGYTNNPLSLDSNFFIDGKSTYSVGLQIINSSYLMPAFLWTSQQTSAMTAGIGSPPSIFPSLFQIEQGRFLENPVYAAITKQAFADRINNTLNQVQKCSLYKSDEMRALRGTSSGITVQDQHEPFCNPWENYVGGWCDSSNVTTNRNFIKTFGGSGLYYSEANLGAAGSRRSGFCSPK